VVAELSRDGGFILFARFEAADTDMRHIMQLTETTFEGGPLFLFCSRHAPDGSHQP